MARIVEESYIADLKNWAEGRFAESENGMGYALLEVAVDLENMPIVTHCKDCWKSADGLCSYQFKNVPGKDFCGDGERKDNG